jgi:hypothetical protein
MSEAEAHSSASGGAEQTVERIDKERREALTRLAKYTAPAMLAVLMSVEYSRATMVVCGGPPPASDTRLKRDIAQVGEVDNGINLYRYRYRLGSHRGRSHRRKPDRRIRPCVADSTHSRARGRQRDRCRVATAERPGRSRPRQKPPGAAETSIRGRGLARAAAGWLGV